MITWPRLHDITASLNAHGRVVLKNPSRLQAYCIFQRAPAAQLVSMRDQVDTQNSRRL